MKPHASKFKGTITQISLSPHGMPEGIVLDSEVFVKIPPHTLINPELLQVGAEVTGSGESSQYKLNKTIRHAQVFIDDELVADDQLGPKENDELKEKHHKDIKKMKAPKKNLLTREGTVIAVSSKKHGEVDRLLLDDGTSVHIPKEIEVHEDDFKLGDLMYIEGEGQEFEDHSFLRAQFIMNEEGQILSV
jgi:hypothetical protein